MGLGLLVLARALFRRVQAAYYISVWLLIAGIFASLLKGLDFEEASLLALVLGVLVLGRRAFYRPTAILEERFTPVWIASITGVIAMALWIGLVSWPESSIGSMPSARKKSAAFCAPSTSASPAARKFPIKLCQEYAAQVTSPTVFAASNP